MIHEPHEASVPSADWWRPAAQHYVGWQMEALVYPAEDLLQETVAALRPHLSPELAASLQSPADTTDTAEDSSSSMFSVDIPEVPLEADADEATVALEDGVRLVLGRHGEGARLRRIELQPEADGSPHPLETLLHHALSWRGWAISQALRRTSRWWMRTPRRGPGVIPDDVSACSKVLEHAVARLMSMLAQWRRDHRIYLHHYGESGLQRQEARFIDGLETRLPRLSLGAPYAVKGLDTEPGTQVFAVDLAANLLGAATWTISLNLHWNTEDGVLTDLTCPLPWGNISLQELNNTEAPSQAQYDLPHAICLSCDGSGIQKHQQPEHRQLATSPPHWMRPWYAFISRSDPDTLGAPKTFCSACTGSGLLQADPSDPSHWFQAERIIERSRQLSGRTRALLWAYGILGWMGTAAMISGLYRAKHVLTPTFVAIASTLGFFLAYWGLCSIYHLATHQRLRWKAPTDHRIPSLENNGGKPKPIVSSPDVSGLDVPKPRRHQTRPRS